MAEDSLTTEEKPDKSRSNHLSATSGVRDLQRQTTVTDSRGVTPFDDDDDDDDDSDADEDDPDDGEPLDVRDSAQAKPPGSHQHHHHHHRHHRGVLRGLFSSRRRVTWRKYPLVHVNDRDANAASRFPHNTQRTTKYTLWTFLPKNLFEQFRRATNIYFLVVVIVTLIPQVSPLDPVTSLLPVIFVLTVTALKEAFEDYKRYQADKVVNQRPYRVLDPADGKARDVPCKDVKVGDVLLLRQDDPIPADCLLLWSALPEGLCYVDTAQLDGETNLKELRALHDTFALDESQLHTYRAEVEAEVPHADLYKFRANLRSTSGKHPDGVKVSLDTKQLLLRGARLRNTPRAYAAIVYNGRDTKLTLNQRLPPSKFSTMETRLNRSVLGLVVFQVICVICCTIGAVMKKSLDSGKELWYMDSLATQNAAISAVTNFFSYFVLLSFIIPMSLMVTLEVVKLIQAKLMEWDDEMRPLDRSEDESGGGMKAKTSNLNDELGLVKYIFSDKTGTLTENRMVFSKCSVNGARFESPMDGELREQLSVAGWTPRTTTASQQVSQTADFLRALALCHSSIADVNPETKAIAYQAQSPDEISLCDAARQNDFVFYERTSSTISVRELGVERHYELLTSMDFTSDRRRMSVIVRTPEGKIKMYSKGSDAIMLPRLAPQSGHEAVSVRGATAQHLDDYSKAGLRTLIVACKELTPDQFATFDELYKRASTAIVRREEQVEAVCDAMERELRLVGCTAIEDRLQADVPETIAYLLKAGIRIWVITGDKQETAINIGYSCALLDPAQPLVIVDASTSDEVGAQIRAGLKWFRADAQNPEAPVGRQQPKAGEPGAAPPEIGLVLNGSALAFAIIDHAAIFLKLAAQATSVVCCRVTPLQKAQIVQLVRRSLSVVTLAIGDGANDVSMIQVAHIGVGIVGKEGTQAARAADYALRQFSHLRQLISVHGRYSLLRNALCIQSSLYKNLAFFYVQFWFAFFNDFSGQTLVDDWIVTAYNIVLTSLPPLFIALMEKDLSEKTIRENPECYREVSSGRRFTYRSLSGWLLSALYHSIVFYCVFVLFVGDDGVLPEGRQMGLWGSAGMVATYGVLTCLTKISLETKYWTWLTWLGLLVSIVNLFIVLGCISSFPVGWPQGTSVINVLFETPAFYLAVVVTLVACLLPDFSLKYVRRQFFPQAWQILQEREQLQLRLHRVTATAKTALPGRRRRSSQVAPASAQAETVRSLPIFEHDLSRDSAGSIGGAILLSARRNQVRPTTAEPREILVRTMSSGRSILADGSNRSFRGQPIPDLIHEESEDLHTVHDATRNIAALRDDVRSRAVKDAHLDADASGRRVSVDDASSTELVSVSDMQSARDIDYEAALAARDYDAALLSLVSTRSLVLNSATADDDGGVLSLSVGGGGGNSGGVRRAALLSPDQRDARQLLPAIQSETNILAD